MWKPTKNQSDLIFDEYKDYKTLCEENGVEAYKFNSFVNEVIKRGFNNICGIVKQTKDIHKTKKQEIE